jgi:hypothetical protein
VYFTTPGTPGKLFGLSVKESPDGIHAQGPSRRCRRARTR